MIIPPRAAEQEKTTRGVDNLLVAEWSDRPGEDVKGPVPLIVAHNVGEDGGIDRRHHGEGVGWHARLLCAACICAIRARRSGMVTRFLNPCQRGSTIIGNPPRGRIVTLWVCGSISCPTRRCRR